MGAIPLPSLPRDPHNPTPTEPLSCSSPSPSKHPHLSRPDASRHRHQPREGQGRGWGRQVVGGAPSGQSHLSHTPAPGTLPPPRLWCRAQKGAEEEERRGGQGGTGRFCGSVCGKVFFFSPFSPFSYVKSARKLGSLFATVSSVSWGREGGEGTPGLAPQLGTEGGLILLRNVGFSLNTRQ